MTQLAIGLVLRYLVVGIVLGSSLGVMAMALMEVADDD